MSSDKSVVMPAGEYWLGDPCYSVPDELWSPWLEAADFSYSHPVLDAIIPGTTHRVLGFSTAYGDGGYPGSDGFEYGVDSGLIGLVPVALADTKHAHMVQRITFTEPTSCQRISDGTLIFGTVTIETGDQPEDDDEYDYDNEEEEDE